MFGKKAILPFILIIASIVLLILNIIELNKNNSSGNIYGPISNVLLILAMIFVIIGNRRSSQGK